VPDVAPLLTPPVLAPPLSLFPGVPPAPPGPGASLPRPSEPVFSPAPHPDRASTSETTLEANQSGLEQAIDFMAKQQDG
jgi:hypothetical protein